MVNRKKRKARPTEAPSNEKSTPIPANGAEAAMFGELLSMAGYFSGVGVHTTLWVFVAFYLPRTTFLVDLTGLERGKSQVSSRDRPQHPFLTPLTASPAFTLLYICIGGIILQSWWAEWMRDWWLQLGLKGTEEENRTEKAFYDRQKLTTFRNAWIATFAASLAIHAILMLFGAPLARFRSFTGRTYLLALLISMMTVYSPAYTIGVPDWGSSSTSAIRRWTWVRLFAEFAPRNGVERALLFPAIGTVAGCWLGIIPIALDWDRPWQAWPLTPAFGAIAGYIASSTVALSVNGVVHMAQEYSRAQHDATEQKSK